MLTLRLKLNTVHFKRIYISTFDTDSVDRTSYLDIYMYETKIRITKINYVVDAEE